MSSHKTINVFVADYWGTRGPLNPTAGTAEGIPNTAITGQQYFIAPKGGGGNLAAGDLIVANSPEYTPYNLTGVQAPSYAQKAYDTNRDSIVFGIYDSLRGIRTSDTIRYDMIDHIIAKDPEVRTPHVVFFSLPYSVSSSNYIIAKGDEAAIRVSAYRGDRELGKRDYFANTFVGGEVASTNPKVGAFDNEIQAAHFTLLQQILQSDPEGYYFDAPASLALSLEMNYGVVALVGATKRVFNFDGYAEFVPTILDVSIIKGSSGSTQRNWADMTNNQDTPPQPGYVDLVSNVLVNRNLSFVGTAVVANQGSGYFDSVRWKERENLGNWGHTNTGQGAFATQPVTLAKEDRLYKFVNIHHHNVIDVKGENTRRFSAQALYIYLAYMDENGDYVPPSEADWRYNTAVTDPFGGLTISPTEWAAQTANNPTAPTPWLATYASLSVPLTTAGYVAPTLPAQGGVNALFSLDSNIAAPTGAPLDGSIAVGTPFINRLSNTLFT